MTTGGEFSCGPKGMFNVSFECEGTIGASEANGDTSIIGAVVGVGCVVEVVELIGLAGAGVEGGGSSEELEMDVMLLKEVFFTSHPKPGKEIFWGIIATDEFAISEDGIVTFEDSTLIVVAFAGIGISATVVFSEDVSLIC